MSETKELSELWKKKLHQKKKIVKTQNHQGKNI